MMLHHSLVTSKATLDLKAQETLTELIDNNQTILETKITDTIIK
jgi:hypothetical protein